MSAQVTISQLPTAGAITGTELVPVVQNGVTVQTTTSAIAGSPTQTYSYLTVTQTPQLANSRYVGVTNGLTITDGGAQGLFNISTTGALLSLVNSGTGFQVKTSGTAITPRSIAVSNSGLSISNGSGVSGDPTITLSGAPLNLANLSANGLLTITTAGAVGAVTLQGTTNQITVTYGNAVGGSPTIALADNPVLPGISSTTLPAGATGDRPASPTNGMIRYNTTIALFEGYINGAWSSLAAGSGVTSIATGTGLTGGPITSTGTISIDSTVVTLTGAQTLTNKTISGASNTLSNIANASLSNSTISGVALGGSLFNLTAGTGVSFSSGTTYNGSNAITISATGSGGTVTSVSFTGGIISVGTATTTPALTVAGTSGGIPYFSSTSAWASSAALAANAIVLGGGAGAAPATTTTGTGVVAALGNTTNAASGIVVKDANANITTNFAFLGFTNVAAAGTTTTLVVSSTPNFVVTGSGGQTYKLPDATTLANGATYTFNNNQSSGTIVVQNNSSTTIVTVQSGAFVTVILLSNSTAAGSWDYHAGIPSGTFWSTNTLSTGAAITSTQAVTGSTLVSTVATGTAPLTVASTTQVANLNAATAGTATNVTLSAGTGATNYIPFSATATGNQPLTTNTLLTYNYTNNALTAGVTGGTF